jgi:hypothetical protein
VTVRRIAVASCAIVGIGGERKQDRFETAGEHDDGATAVNCRSHRTARHGILEVVAPQRWFGRVQFAHSDTLRINECTVPHGSLGSQPRKRMSSGGIPAMLGNFGDDSQELSDVGIVTVHRLESLPVVRTNTDAQSRTVRLVDDAAHLEAQHLAADDTVFDDDVGIGPADSFGKNEMLAVRLDVLVSGGTRGHHAPLARHEYFDRQRKILRLSGDRTEVPGAQNTESVDGVAHGPQQTRTHGSQCVTLGEINGIEPQPSAAHESCNLTQLNLARFVVDSQRRRGSTQPQCRSAQIRRPGVVAAHYFISPQRRVTPTAVWRSRRGTRRSS